MNNLSNDEFIRNLERLNEAERKKILDYINALLEAQQEKENALL